MSKESAIKLLEISETNSDLSKQLNNSKNVEEVIQIGAEYNCHFTKEEVLEIMQEKQLSFASDTALSEEQLEAIVGGKGDNNRTNEYTDASTKSKVNA